MIWKIKNIPLIEFIFNFKMYLIPKTAFEEDENLSSDAYFFDFEAKQQINNENFGLFFTRA